MLAPFGRMPAAAMSTSVALVSSTSSGTTAHGARAEIERGALAHRRAERDRIVAGDDVDERRISVAVTPSTVARKLNVWSPRSEASGVQRNIASPLA